MWILYLIAIYWGFYFIAWLYKSIIEKRHQKIRDEVAHKIFDNSGIEITIENSKKKLSGISLAQTQGRPEKIPYWQYSRLPKYAQKIANSICPMCSKGYLNVDYSYNRFGRVPSFFSCSNKLECVYRIGLKQAKEEFTEENKGSFKKDFNEAYS